MTDDLAKLRRHVEDMTVQLALCVGLVTELEWSGSAVGQSTGMGLNNGAIYARARCPECGGLNPEDDRLCEWTEEAFGHRSGCKIALALRRPTRIPEGQTGRLAI